MKSKVMTSFTEATADIADGSTVIVGGFDFVVFLKN